MPKGHRFFSSLRSDTFRISHYNTPGSRFMRFHIMRIRSYATILNVPDIRFMREKFHIMRCCAVVYARRVSEVSLAVRSDTLMRH